VPKLNLYFHFRIEIHFKKLCKNLIRTSQRHWDSITKTGNETSTFIGACILIHSHSTTNKKHLLSQIIYTYKMLYMFRTVFPSIIRSSKLCIQQWYMSKSCCYLLQQVAAAVWHIPLPYAQFWAPDDGRKDRSKHVEHFIRINNLR